jgi:mRNA-degrading endonuclease RelE of RelBE toxin-antitoxin system
VDPTVGDPLRDRLDGYRRIRIGRWRVVYRPRGRIIEVVIVGPRDTVYGDLLTQLGRR